MTTDLNNPSYLGLNRPIAQQLPPVNKAQNTKVTDNVVRINFQQRQETAETEISKADADDSNVKRNQSTDEISSSVSDLNTATQMISRNLEFHVDSNSGKTIITVRDTNSKEVIRQIPSEQLLEISEKLKKLQESDSQQSQATGILFKDST